MKSIQIITSLSPSRWKEYRDLRLEALQLFPNMFTSKYEEQKESPKSVWLNGLQDSSMDILFAQRSDKLVGMLMALYIGDKLHINGMYVKPAYGRKGIGSELLQEAIRRAKSKEFTIAQLEVFESNTEAINFYENSGFLQKSKKKGKTPDGSDVNEILMEMIFD